jgi:hypothetical protein
VTCHFLVSSLGTLKHFVPRPPLMITLRDVCNLRRAVDARCGGMAVGRTPLPRLHRRNTTARPLLAGGWPLRLMAARA